MIGQSFSSHGYRILTSLKHPSQLHPLVDFIIYDPAEHGGKLMSEHIFESIFMEMIRDVNATSVNLEIKVYNMIDTTATQKVLKLDISEVPNLEFISSLIHKIQEAKEQNLVEEF